MSADYKHEIGYERLLKDFERYQKQSPTGISLKRNRNTINLQFKVGNKERKPYGCNCSFTLDGMVSALSKARKVAEALKNYTSESEFWEWYNYEIKDIGKIENDLLTFRDAIAVIETDFWNRRDRRNRKRIKGHPSDEATYKRTYDDFYKLLPQNKVFNLKDIEKVLTRWKQGDKQFKEAMNAFRKLASFNGFDSIYKKLKKINSTQTNFKEKQEIDLERFIEWRNEVLGITTKLHPSCDIDIRQSWLWVLGMQIFYGLRISEVFAIKNLDKPVYNPKNNKIAIYPYNDSRNNPHRIIYIGEETIIGTTTKTLARPVKPMESNKYPNLYYEWDLHNPKLPPNRPKKDSKPQTLTGFFGNIIRQNLKRWKAPFTQTHADRRLGNLLGIQSGLTDTILAKNLGHTPLLSHSEN